MRPEYSPSAWEQEGFTEDFARLWAGLGLSPSGALSFYEAGFSVEEARPWVEIGFRNTKICKGWRDAGFEPEETKVYLSFGLHIEHAKRLKDWKITALHLSPYCGQTKLTKSLDNLFRELDSLRATIRLGPPEWSLDDPELNPTHLDWQRALSAVFEQLIPDLLIEAARQEVPAAELLTAQVYGIPLMDYLKYRSHGLSLKQAREHFQAGVKPEDFVKGAE